MATSSDNNYRDPFGESFDLPSFPHPDSFRRNVVPGLIPSPTLLTERVNARELALGDKILYLGSIIATVSNFDTESPALVAVCKTGAWTDGNPYLRIVGMVDRILSVTFGLISKEIPIEWLRDDTIQYHGKFSSQWEQYCWEQALENYSSIGHCDEIGWVASRIDITSVDDQVFPCRQDSVLAQWQDEIGQYPAGYIVTEDDRGAVDVSFFDSIAELDQEWSRLEEIVSSHYAEDEEV